LISQPQCRLRRRPHVSGIQLVGCTATLGFGSARPAVPLGAAGLRDILPRVQPLDWRETRPIRSPGRQLMSHRGGVNACAQSAGSGILSRPWCRVCRNFARDRHSRCPVASGDVGLPGVGNVCISNSVGWGSVTGVRHGLFCRRAPDRRVTAQRRRRSATS
jgi:hypothetical protein